MPVAHHEDDVRVADGGEAVGDDEARSALHEAGERVLHDELGARIDGGGRFVEDQRGREREHYPRDAQKLLLPLGERSAGFAEDGIVALRQP